MAKKVKETGAGVVVGGVRVSLLLFADDVVLVAETREDLQRSLNACWTYSRKWRFNFNVGPGKSEVLVCGGRREGERWWLGDEEMRLTESYCYLGVILNEEKSWVDAKERLVSKASKSLWRLVGMGMCEEGLTMYTARDLVQTCVRPILEYGCEVVCDRKWEQAEVLQRKAGRLVLGVSSATANGVVQGELGWWRVKGRTDYLKLMFFAKLSQERGLLKTVFDAARKKGEGKGSTWGRYMDILLSELGLGEHWVTGRVGEREGWRRSIRMRIQDREWMEWRASMIGKVTLDRYRRIKTRLRMEPFLRRYRTGARRLVGLRAGVERLQVVRGRHRGIPREERRCLVCEGGEVEDEEHFIERCSGEGVRRRREEMWGKCNRIMHEHMRRRVRGMTSEERVDWLLGSEWERGEWKWRELYRVVMNGLGGMFVGRGKTGLRRSR